MPIRSGGHTQKNDTTLVFGIVLMIHGPCPGRLAPWSPRLLGSLSLRTISISPLCLNRKIIVCSQVLYMQVLQVKWQPSRTKSVQLFSAMLSGVSHGPCCTEEGTHWSISRKEYFFSPLVKRAIAKVIRLLKLVVSLLLQKFPGQVCLLDMLCKDGIDFI